MKLVARWKVGEGERYEYPQELVELPQTIAWEDGTPATIEDFTDHLGDTTEWLSNDGYREARIYPGACAVLKFEDFLGHWVVGGANLPVTSSTTRTPMQRRPS